MNSAASKLEGMVRLSAAAAPFVPSPAPPEPMNEDTQQGQSAEPPWEVELVDGCEGYYDEWGAWIEPASQAVAAAYSAYDHHQRHQQYDHCDHYQYSSHDASLYRQEQCYAESWNTWRPSTAGADTDSQETADGSWGDVTADISPADAVTMLCSWYPSQPRPVVQQVLEACNRCLQEASNILCDMEWDQRLARRNAAGSNNSSSGGGGGSSAAHIKRQPEFELQEDSFPALSAGAAAKQQQSSNGCSAADAATGKAAGVWEGPASSNTGSRSNSTGGDSSWARVAGKAGTAATAAGHASQGAADSWPSLGAGKSAAGQPSRSNRAGRAAAGDDAAVPWVQTGAAVEQEYEAARAEARDYARLRNTCFHQATIAYLAGNKALAKDLSAKGKQAAEQMFAAHERASQQLFTQRNARLAAEMRSAGSSSSSSSVIDLHGLHVREVQAALPQQLQQLAAQKQCKCVSLIVGTGHHTKGPPTARLGPAVEQLLQSLGYRYRQPQPGLLKVSLV